MCRGGPPNSKVPLSSIPGVDCTRKEREIRISDNLSIIHNL